MDRRRIIISCEHAGNKVPTQFRFLFKGKESVLQSHLGWDPGAFSVARSLADALKVRLFHQDYSRLLIECNRSLDNPELFSKYSTGLNDMVKDYLIRKYYLSYRKKVERAIGKILDKGKPVLHLSIHSFTPALNGTKRKADLGLLYDPDRRSEEDFSVHLKNELEILSPNLLVKFNYPYLGTDDGFTTYLRTKFPDDSYAGIEIEVNQNMTAWPARKKIQRILTECIRKMYFEVTHELN
ncbi:MAG TPA: N-formylglutamate amidohydrolase [Cyclobacteriaceae bacterium]|jgi:predicted N-formylglutamate amidohydrolase